MHRTTTRRAIGLVGMAALMAASLGGGAAAQDEPVALTYLVDDTQNSQDTAKALAAAYTALHPNVTIDVETPPGRHRRRQHRQDPPRDRRHGRHLLVQLRLAAPGPEPDARRSSTSRTSRSSPTSPSRSCPTVSQNGGIFGVPSGTAMGGGILYNKKIYADLGLTRAHDLGRVRGQQREDQGGRHRARSARPTATPGPPSCSCSPTTTTSRRPIPDFADGLHRQQGQVRRRPRRRWPASSTCRRASRRAGTRRTSARPSSTMA